MSTETLALELASLKKTASECLAKGDMDGFLDSTAREIALHRKLRLEITANNFIKVESKAAKDLLRKIRSDVSEEEQAMDEILSKVEDEGTCGLLVEDAADIDDLTGELLYSWFNPREYVVSLFRTGAIVIRCTIPFELKNLVEEARQCFAFQQCNAVFCLCRTILETAVTDIGVRIGKIPQSAPTRHDFYRQYPPWERIDSVASGDLRRELHEFYESASELIHGRKTAGPADALQALKSTLSMVERLYSQHGRTISANNR